MLQAKLIAEKSMIGRLQNELVRVNSQVGELDTQLERLKRAEAKCERLQMRVAELESGRGDADSNLSAAKSKARHDPSGVMEIGAASCRSDWRRRTCFCVCRGTELSRSQALLASDQITASWRPSNVRQHAVRQFQHTPETGDKIPLRCV